VPRRAMKPWPRPRARSPRWCSRTNGSTYLCKRDVDQRRQSGKPGSLSLHRGALHRLAGRGRDAEHLLVLRRVLVRREGGRSRTASWSAVPGCSTRTRQPMPRCSSWPMPLRTARGSRGGMLRPCRRVPGCLRSTIPPAI
jgi:hypothetical protein